MKKLNQMLNIIIGAFVGVFIGHSIYIIWDFNTHPALYAAQSAPWYTSILVYGAATAVVLLIALMAKFFIKRQMRKQSAN